MTAQIELAMPQRTLILLLCGGVCFLSTVTRGYAQDATERHGITAGMGLGHGWVSQDLCPPSSCDAGIGVTGQVGWVWRNDWAVVWGFADVDAGGIGVSSFSWPSVNLQVNAASIKYWPRTGRGWLSAGAGFSKVRGEGTLKDDADVSSSTVGVLLGAGWEMWRNQKRMTLDLSGHTLALPYRENWITAASITVDFN
jgi:hypothetical protein